MNAEIISIGDELLIGQVINTNASWIAQKLNLVGISIKQITVVSDEKQHIKEAIDLASSRAEIILITGGLGPTNDDITKITLCEYFDCELVFDYWAFGDIEELFGQRGLPVTEINKKQAELPEKCFPIRNTCGTAPGMWFDQNGKIIISMPGVPFEMKPMMEDFIIPKLQEHFKLPNIFHKTILTQGVGESFLSETIADWENSLPSHIKLAYLPSPGIVRLRLSGQGIDKAQIRNEIMSFVKTLNSQIPQYIYGYDDDLLEEIIGKLLNAENKTISTAESCTGGFISHKITSVPGSSKYFKGSFIAYSDEIKTDFLGVKKVTILNFGAVSEQTAIEMAMNVMTKFNTDYAISATGIAGPDGGTEEKPIGLTWIAIASPEGVFAKKFLFGESRERTILKTSIQALNMLRKLILEESVL